MKFGAMLALSLVLMLLANARVSVAGRPVEIWQPDRLWKQAAIVVMAIADKSESRDLAGAKPNTWVPVRTTFAVKAVLKGRLSAKHLTLLHYRYQVRKAEIEEIDGPVFVRFDTRTNAAYLLFLKAPKIEQQGAETAYEPLTGQMDPGGSFSRLVPVGL